MTYAEQPIKVPFAHLLEFPNGIRLLKSWQDGETDRLDELRAVYQAAIDGEYDSIFSEPSPEGEIHIGGSHDMLPLSLAYDLLGIEAESFYTGDPERYVRIYLMTRRLLGLNKVYLSWPCYALTAQAIGQDTMYTDKFPPGSNPDNMLLNRDNWKDVKPVDLVNGLIPRCAEEMMRTYERLTGLEPILHLSAPYSLAADTYGQEPLLAALVHEPEMVVEMLHHLVDVVYRPWLNDIIKKFPNAWLEFADASGSPFFIGPKNCKDISSEAIRYLIEGEPWGDRVYVANYRGDYVTQATKRDRRSARGRGKESAAAVNVTLQELSEAKFAANPVYVQRLFDDRVPVSFYRDFAIEKNVPLYAGIGARQIDRNGIPDMDEKKSEIRADTQENVEAIKDVTRAIRDNGYTDRKPPWPGTLYFEDISAESSMELIEVIIELAIGNSQY